jgi:hypothetical protein
MDQQDQGQSKKISQIHIIHGVILKHREILYRIKMHPGRNRLCFENYIDSLHYLDNDRINIINNDLFSNHRV